MLRDERRDRETEKQTSNLVYVEKRSVKSQVPNAKCCVTNREKERRRNRETEKQRDGETEKQRNRHQTHAQTGLIGPVISFF